MADIELVVKIPEEAYKLLKNEGVDWLGAEHILNAVANGILLQKGHDRLVEANAVIKALFSKKTIDDVPTIIEADKEQEDDKIWCY